jgi:choline kinase
MKAIILAAGMGKRLQKASGGLPKTMINIGGISIIHRQIESCLKVGIKDFVFVLGFKYDQVKHHIMEKIADLSPKFILNPDYATTNTLHSLWLARNEMDEDFLYFNADVIFDLDMIELLNNDDPFSKMLVEFKTCGEEEVKVILDQEKRITSIGKKLDPEKCSGEFIGIARFKRSIIADFAVTLEKGVQDGYSNTFFEFAVDKLTDDHLLHAVSTDGFNCLEIDFPEDLEKARMIFS